MIISSRVICPSVDGVCKRDSMTTAHNADMTCSCRQWWQCRAHGRWRYSESDTISVGETSTETTDLYSLEEVNQFLDETFKKSVSVSDYFSDTDKFIRSVDVLKRLVGFDLLDEKNAFASINIEQI